MDRLKEIFKRFEALGDLDALKRDGKDYSFSDIHHLIVITYRNLKDIIDNPQFWDSLPQNIQIQTINPFDQFTSSTERIHNFNPQSGDNQNTRDAISREIRSYYDQLYTLIFLPLEVFNVKKALSSSNLKELSTQAQDVLTEINKRNKQSEELVENIKETAQVGGVSKFAGIFDKEAQHHRKVAYIWLIVSALAAGGMIWFLIDTFAKLTSALSSISVGGDNISITLQLFFGKILILSFFSVVFYQIVKNYNANMHLYVINKHRENSLRTFQSFVSSTDDQKTKDVILVQSTQTIFAAGETGYISSKDQSPSFDAIRVMEQAQK